MYAALIAAGCAFLLWLLPNPTCRCPSCPVHTNERNMARLRRAEAVHDMKHRGVKAPGFPAPTRDRFPCDDPECSPNPVRR